MLLQAAAFLPPPPPSLAAPAAYQARVQAILRTEQWSDTDLRRLRPRDAKEAGGLIGLLRTGSAREALLAAFVVARSEPDEELALACVAAACQLGEEDAALACLLAPPQVPPACLPALAYLALEAQRPLSVRAAAIARLLDADLGRAWPLARSVLRTGTPLDEDAPWADWERGGRYELPKRILLASMQDWLRRHGQAPTDYEPNASWPEQEAALARLEAVAEPLAALPMPLDGDDPRRTEALNALVAATASDPRAGRACAVLAAGGFAPAELSIEPPARWQDLVPR